MGRAGARAARGRRNPGTVPNQVGTRAVLERLVAESIALIAHRLTAACIVRSWCCDAPSPLRPSGVVRLSVGSDRLRRRQPGAARRPVARAAGRGAARSGNAGGSAGTSWCARARPERAGTIGGGGSERQRRNRRRRAGTRQQPARGSGGTRRERAARRPVRAGADRRGGAGGRGGSAARRSRGGAGGRGAAGGAAGAAGTGGATPTVQARHRGQHGAGRGVLSGRSLVVQLGLSRTGGNTGIEFVPMVWGSSTVNSTIPAGSKYLLGFNEPNFKAQSNLTPQAAATAWPALQTNARNAGVPIVSGPALNFCGPAANCNGTDPYVYLKDFLAACTELPGRSHRRALVRRLPVAARLHRIERQPRGLGAVRQADLADRVLAQRQRHRRAAGSVHARGHPVPRGPARTSSATRGSAPTRSRTRA